MDFSVIEAIGKAHGLDEEGRLEMKLAVMIDNAADENGWFDKSVVWTEWNCSDDGCIRNRGCSDWNGCWCGAECGCCDTCGAPEGGCVCCAECGEYECACEEDDEYAA